MKLKNTCISACVCALGFVALGACHESVSVGAPSTTSAAVVDNSQAINSITYARCSRENACNNIGAQDKTYSTFDACVKELNHDTGITLRADKCPQGVLADRLDGCLNDIRTERCGNPLDTIERIGSCRKGMLCKGQI
jgi:hypothetical protein